MALPNIVAPEYTATLPSNGLEVKFRPFLVKEEKLLLFAAESNERADMINAVCQMMKNCIIEPDIEPDKLPFFDFEHIFLHIRSKSVGEAANFSIKHDVEECGHMNDVSVRLDKIIHKKEDNHDSKIQLNDTLGVKMKYPTIETIKQIEDINATNILEMFSNIMILSFPSEMPFFIHLSLFSKAFCPGNLTLSTLFLGGLFKHSCDRKLISFLKTSSPANASGSIT